MTSELGYRIEIDRDVCMGSGLCAVFAPETFELDDEVTSTVVDPAGNPRQEIEDAASGCPVGAIRIIPT